MKMMLLALFFVSPVFAQLVKKDPYKQKLTAPFTHAIKVRLLYHGTKDRKDWIEDQMKATQLIYAQCGVNLRFDVVSTEILPKSTAQEKLTFPPGDKSGRIFYSQEGYDFLLETAAGKRADVLDIHVVQHLSEGIRLKKTTKNSGGMDLGVAYNPATTWLYTTRIQESGPRASDIYGGSLFLAADTVKLQKDKNENFTIYTAQNKKSFDRHLSLLAHEMGHILLEVQTDPKNGYKDHYCSGLGESCPNEYLMSGGGYPDRTWEDARTRWPLGYDPLPSLDKLQCSSLKGHPFLTKL